MDISNRIVVVTGGARGIGRALARRFSSGGAGAVVVVDIDGDKAAAVAEEIGGTAVRCDVSREEEVVRLVKTVQDQHSRIDVFCSNAGIAVAGGPEVATAEWQRIWDINVMSHVFVARHVLPGMLARDDGYILGTLSAASLLNHVLAAPYGVTKAAALSLFEWLAIAYGGGGIRVSCLCPQGVNTDMLATESRELLDYVTPTALEPEDVAEAVIQGLRDEAFLILPQPQVAKYFSRKAHDYDRWLRSMRKLRASFVSALPNDRSLY
jgi:NAD(P)-dependent dehydrogenase (short-subunit alcohol dehydrogenase family)